MKIIKFLFREFISTSKLKLKLPYFLKKQSDVSNSLFIYFLVSSFSVRILARVFLKYFKTKFVPIKVVYRHKFVLYFPLFAYLQHTGDLFNLYYDYYFKDFTHFFKRKFTFNENDIVVDIGAHIGTFSIPLAMNNPIRVFAIEPDRINSNYLRRNIEVNSLDNRMVAIQKAIFSTTGESEFVEGDASTRGTLSTTAFSRMVSSNNRYTVETATFRDILKSYNIDKIKLLKIDCEGAEYDIMKGFDSNIFSMIENIFIEIHQVGDKDNDPQELIRFIKSHGFAGDGNALDNGCFEYYFSKEAHTSVN